MVPGDGYCGPVRSGFSGSSLFSMGFPVSGVRFPGTEPNRLPLGGFRHLLFEPMDGADADVQLSGRRVDTHTLLQGAPDLIGLVGIEAGAPRLFGAARKARHDPGTDHLTLKIGKDTEHPEHRPSAGRRGIERLLVEIEVHPLGVDLSEEGDEIL